MPSWFFGKLRKLDITGVSRFLVIGSNTAGHDVLFLFLGAILSDKLMWLVVFYLLANRCFKLHEFITARFGWEHC